MWATRCGWSNTIIIKYNLSVLLYSKESKAIIWQRDEVCSSGFKLALSSEFATRIIFQVFAHWSLLRLLDTLVRIFLLQIELTAAIVTKNCSFGYVVRVPIVELIIFIYSSYSSISQMESIGWPSSILLFDYINWFKLCII